MNLNEMSLERQVGYLRSLLRSGKGTLTGYMALFAFRHHLASKHSPDFSQKPVIRWYLGQLAKEYIKRYFNEAKTTLKNFAEIGLLEAKGEADDAQREFHLNECSTQLFWKSWKRSSERKPSMTRLPGRNTTGIREQAKAERLLKTI